jgi:hypothetical protein
VQGTSSYVYLGPRVIHGWAVQLVLIAALLPFVITTIDLFARCRRRRIPLAPAVRALRSRLAFWAFAGLVFTCFRLLGAFGGGPARPPNPAAASAGDWPALVLLGLLVVVVAGWLVARYRIAPRRQARPEEVVAGQTVALLALAIVALLVIGTNPFALVFVLPALHAWLWLPQVQHGHPLARLGLFALGLLGPALVLFSLAWRFGLGLDAPWYLLHLVVVGYIGWLPVVIALAGAAAAAQLAAAACGRYAPYPDVREGRPPGPLRELVRVIVLGRRARRRAQRARLRAVGS